MPNPEQSAFTFLPLGGIIQEFRVAGINIVQGFRTQEDYVKHNAPFFGATIGRTSNRLRDAVINNLNGETYTFAKNNGPNSLHGGTVGWGKQIFDGPTAVQRHGKEAISFKYLSKDGDENYPGTVELRVWYIESKEDGGDPSSPNAKIVLDIEYEVEFIGDECEETAVSITNHSYFNLSGEPTIAGTIAELCTDKYLPIDSTGIPLGTIDTFNRDGTKVQVTTPFTLSATEPDIDDCFIVETDPSKVPIDTRPLPLKRLAAFRHPTTNLHLEVYSTEPAFQVYTGRFLDVPELPGTPARGRSAGFCVEPSRYVNAPNVPEWRDMTILKRGQTWGSRIVYHAWKE